MFDAGACIEGAKPGKINQLLVDNWKMTA